MKFINRILCSLLLGALIACGQSNPEQYAPTDNDPPAKIYVPVAADAGYPPFAQLNEVGLAEGFDIDLLKAIAEQQNLNLAFYNVPFSSIFSHLESGEAKILAAAITITPAREQKYDFSNPYFSIHQLIMVPESSSVQKLDDLSGQLIGVKAQTTSDSFISNHFGADSAHIVRFPEIGDAFKAINEGSIAAVISDGTILEDYIKKNPNQKYKTILDPVFPEENFGFAFVKNDTLRHKVNAGLEAVRANGTYDEIYKKYF